MARKQILVMASSDEEKSRLDTIWSPMAKECDAELLYTKPENKEEFMGFFRSKDNNVVAVANSFLGARAMGGYSSEMIRELSELGSLKAICHQGAGYDGLGDIDLYKELASIQISNTPGGVGPPTANTAIFLLLAAMRNFFPQSISLHEGKWVDKATFLGQDPKNKVLGIVGMGNIGQLIRDRARPFGFKEIQYYSRNKLSPEIEQDTVYAGTLDHLLKTSDCIIVIVPLNKQTHHLIDAAALEKCKDGVILVNVARGPVIDEEALVKALDSGKVGSVGLDVYENEPKIHQGLLDNKKAYLLPHVGAITADALAESELERVNNVRSLLQTGKVINLVPELRGVF